MVLDVLVYPDKILKTVSKKVGVFDDGLRTFLDDMYETMIAKNGIGLAAIQVGVPKRILLINIPREDEELYKEDLLEIINPEILEASGEVSCEEGCLSVPAYYAEVERFEKVKLQYQDRNAKQCIIEADGLLAIAIQHEMDHLNGVIFVERLPMLKRKKFEKEWKKLHRK